MSNQDQEKALGRVREAAVRDVVASDKSQREDTLDAFTGAMHAAGDLIAAEYNALHTEAGWDAISQQKVAGERRGHDLLRRKAVKKAPQAKG